MVHLRLLASSPRLRDRRRTGPVSSIFPRIVAAMDFSEASLHALRFARSLAAEADAGLTLLHVIDLSPELEAWMAGSERVACNSRNGGGSHWAACAIS